MTNITDLSDEELIKLNNKYNSLKSVYKTKQMTAKVLLNSALIPSAFY